MKYKNEGGVFAQARRPIATNPPSPVITTLSQFSRIVKTSSFEASVYASLDYPP